MSETELLVLVYIVLFICGLYGIGEYLDYRAARPYLPKPMATRKRRARHPWIVSDKDYPPPPSH